MSGGGETTNTNTSSNSSQTGQSVTGQRSATTGWDPVMRGLQSGVTAPLAQFGQTPLTYAGPSYIAPNAQMQQGLQGQANWAQGGGQGVVNNAIGAWGQQLNPMSYLQAPGAMNPLDMYAKNVGRAINENVLPGQRDNAIMAGHTGYSSERNQAEALARARGAESIADYGGNLFSNLYQQGLGASQNALGMAPQMFSLGSMPAELQGRVGQFQRDEDYFRQDLGNQARQFAQMEPYQRAMMMQQGLLPMANLQRTVDTAGSTSTSGTSEGESNSTSETRKQADMLGTLMSAGMMAGGLFTGNPAAVAGGASSLYGGLGGTGGYAPPANVSGAPGVTPWWMQGSARF